MLNALIKMASEKPEELVSLAKHYNRLENTATVAQDNYKDSHQENGKVIYALKSGWVTEREKPGAKILTSSTYPEHHEAITGRRPTKRGGQCAVVVGLLVVQAKTITETDYDNCPCEYITLTSEIAGKCGEDAAHPAMIEAAEILRVRPRTAIKDLKAIKARFVEKVEGEGDDEKKSVFFISEEEAEELAAKSAKPNTLDVQTVLGGLLLGGQCGAMVAALQAHARTTAESKDIQAIVHGVLQMRGAIVENVDAEGKRRFDDETLEAFRAEVEPQVTKDLAYYKAQYQAALMKQNDLQDMFIAAGNDAILEEWATEVLPANEPASIE